MLGGDAGYRERPALRRESADGETRGKEASPPPRGCHGFGVETFASEYDYATFTMTIHPNVSGKPQVLMMHERIINHINRHPGVNLAPCSVPA